MTRYQSREDRERVRSELAAQLTFKRGRVQLSDQAQEEVRHALRSVWQDIGNDVEPLYKNGNVPRSHIIEMVLDADRPSDRVPTAGRSFGLPKKLDPGAEYVLRFPYETDTRSVIHKLAKEAFKDY